MATKPKVKEPTLGELIDTAWKLREDKRAKEAEVKLIDKQLDEAETKIMEALAAQGVDSAKGKQGLASLGKPSIHFSFAEDGGFEEFTKYVKKTGYFHLFQRRLSEAACREILESKGAVPGLKTFEKRRLSLTTVS